MDSLEAKLVAELEQAVAARLQRLGMQQRELRAAADAARQALALLDHGAGALAQGRKFYLIP